MPKCDRCGESTTTTTVSYFNTQTICMECDKIERAHPKFKEAIDTEHLAVNGGDLNFPGVGLPYNYDQHALKWKRENNSNYNCLEKISCPGCGQHEKFSITATAAFFVTDDGTGDYHGDVRWDDDSHVRCVECNHTGTLADFTTD